MIRSDILYVYLRILCMFVNKLSSGSHLAAHKHGSDLGSHPSVLDLYLFQDPGFRTQGGLPELVGIHFPKSFVSLQGEVPFVGLTVPFQGFIVVEVFFLAFSGPKCPTRQNMKKNVVKLNESTLRQIVAESVKKVLKENQEDANYSVFYKDGDEANDNYLGSDIHVG